MLRVGAELPEGISQGSCFTLSFSLLRISVLQRESLFLLLPSPSGRFWLLSTGKCWLVWGRGGWEGLLHYPDPAPVPVALGAVGGLSQ